MKTCSVVPVCRIRMAHDHGACAARFRYGDGGPDGACRLLAGHDGGHDMQRLRRPTPTETPSPARTPATALPPTLPAGAVAGVGGPPAGYVPCDRRGCVRWTYVGGGETPCCWACFCDPDWTPPADAPAKYAPSPFTVTSIDYGTDGRTVVSIIAAPAKPTRPAGITCPRCRCTSEGGTHHLEACPRGDFLPRDAGLTPEQWTARVSVAIKHKRAVQWSQGRPFVPSIDDYDLLGKDVR